jgi:hypothetical protein
MCAVLSSAHILSESSKVDTDAIAAAIAKGGGNVAVQAHAKTRNTARTGTKTTEQETWPVLIVSTTVAVSVTGADKTPTVMQYECVCRAEFRLYPANVNSRDHEQFVQPHVLAPSFATSTWIAFQHAESAIQAAGLGVQRLQLPNTTPEWLAGALQKEIVAPLKVAKRVQSVGRKKRHPKM